MNKNEELDKAEVIRALLELEGRVMLCLDATLKSVEVPRRFKEDQGLRLILNSKMPQPIDIGKETVSSELRFAGIPHYCVVPYEALWGAFNPDSGRGMFWAESMPEVVKQSFDYTQSLEMDDFKPEPRPKQPDLISLTNKQQAVIPAKKRGKPAFQVIDGGRSEQAEEAASVENGAKESAAQDKKKKSTLKLVD